ncbi:MAG TPA: hypothetical protein VK817_26990 [Trebonia sp.]|nr:hypothetical protein [Trebonia sp.]
MTIRVVLADDQPLVRTGLRVLLDTTDQVITASGDAPRVLILTTFDEDDYVFGPLSCSEVAR